MKEIDLHGYSLLDALDKAQDFVEETYYKGEKQIRIIHGRGDGKLKMAVRKMLEELKNENHLRLSWDESQELQLRGGETIVNFED